MKFQSYGTAWKQVLKNTISKGILPPVPSNEVQIIPKKEIIKEKEIKIEKENEIPPTLEVKIKEMKEEEVLEEKFIENEKSKEEPIFLFNKSFKDILLLTLVGIIFFLIMWNFLLVNEIKNYSKTQEKIIEIFLENLLKK